MNKLLKEAIADAKAVRETALANAKLALEEAFTPRLQSMLSARLSEEEEMEMEEDEEMAMDTPVEEVPTEEPAMEEGDYSDEEVSEEEEMDMGNGDNKMDVATASDEEDPGKGKMTEDESTPEEDPALEEGEETEDDVSIDEIIKALREEDEEEVTEGEESEEAEVTEAAEEDLEEAYTVIKFLKSKINEVNLLNAKLLFSNKLFRNFAMNESQKMKVIENFDRASTIREVKLVFSTLAESLKVNKTKRIVKESTASRPTRSTAPKRILSEGNQLASRWAKLAGLNKNN